MHKRSCFWKPFGSERVKKGTPENEQKYKNYKNLFETIKKKAKKIYYSNKLLKCTGDIKKTWNVMKGVVGKSKIKSTNLPRKLTINKVDVYNKPEIADGFNYFFTNIGQKLASQIPRSSKAFETYIVNVIMDFKPLSINELKDAFFPLKINKSSGVDDVSFNIMKKCFGVLCEPLIYLFQLSLEKGVLPDDLKIAKVTPIYKAGDKNDISNCRPTLLFQDSRRFDVQSPLQVFKRKRYSLWKTVRFSKRIFH